MGRDMKRETSGMWARTPIVWAVFLCLCWSARAEAQDGGGGFIGGARPELHLGIFHGDLAVGGRVDIAIVPSGFISDVNDEFAVSPGLEVMLVDDFGLAPLVAFQWNFYIEGRWSVFPELGIAVVLQGRGRDDDLHAEADPVFQIGGRYHLNSRNALVLRVGWPGMLLFGITF